ncbi:MAG: 50S ribosomal protein L10 [Bacteroidota bacterium]
MALTKQKKQEAVAAIAEQLGEVNTVYLTDHAGLTVDEVNQLRASFREAGVTYKVLKNTLVRRAMEDADVDYSGLYDALHGPTAVAFTTDPASPAKVIKKFLDGKEKELPRFKAAYVDGAFFAEGQLDTLAALKSKDELTADIIGLLMAPINNVASALDAQGAGLASVIQQISEKEG